MSDVRLFENQNDNIEGEILAIWLKYEELRDKTKLKDDKELFTKVESFGVTEPTFSQNE